MCGQSPFGRKVDLTIHPLAGEDLVSQLRAAGAPYLGREGLYALARSIEREAVKMAHRNRLVAPSDAIQFRCFPHPDGKASVGSDEIRTAYEAARIALKEGRRLQPAEQKAVRLAKAVKPLQGLLSQLIRQEVEKLATAQPPQDEELPDLEGLL